ncbi:MAG TPA: STAS domain-containing protein [Mycobacteriales bacterium]|jgi:anti-sigma B factor antagonist|nr:STAS domain-containing protein [Mycobacteriales bacterium]
MTETLAPPVSCSGHQLLAPTGDLDLATAPQLRQDLVDASVNGSPLVVLDLRSVAFLDSVGVGVIVGGHKRLRREGRSLHLSGPTGVVRRVLDLTRLDSIIPTFDTLAEAVAGCPSGH